MRTLARTGVQVFSLLLLETKTQDSMNRNDETRAKHRINTLIAVTFVFLFRPVWCHGPIDRPKLTTVDGSDSVHPDAASVVW